MCLGIPGRVVALGPEGMAEVDFGGVRRAVSLALCPEAAVGDWVLVHVGFAIQRLDPQEAEERWELLRELTDG